MTKAIQVILCLTTIINIGIMIVLVDISRLNHQLIQEFKESSIITIESLSDYTVFKQKQLYKDINRFKENVGDNLEFTLSQMILNREAIGNLKALIHLRDVHNLIVTGYTASKDETNKDPTRTAAMIKAKPGIIAVSRDLFEDGWTFGKKVYIETMGVYVIGDLMNRKWEKRIDILFTSKDQAHHFGKRQLTVALLSI